jgi:HD superfamily phosphodiesterase
MYNSILLERLKWRMIEWESGCPQRIQHFLKVASFAVTIARGEGTDEHMLFLAEAAGYIHDIGIRISYERDGRSDGKSQERYGEPAAKEMLTELGFAPEDAETVSHYVGKHHSYDAEIPDLAFRILLEADACVNMFEHAGVSDDARLEMFRNVFQTETGKKLYTTMFGLSV